MLAYLHFSACIVSHSLKDNASEIAYILFKPLIALMSLINIHEENQLHYVYD
jgi:hypothetical protein